ncbi:MAG: IS481 family transposase, partial [Pseudomonadota bacterium]
KILRGLTVFEYVNKCWIENPDCFIKNPVHHFPGLNA